MSMLGGVVLAWLLLGPGCVQAADRDEPIHLEADSLDIDEPRGISVYRGNVHYSQGSTHLWADSVTIQTRKNRELEKVVAEGRPARFQQVPEGEETQVSGQAQRIEFIAEGQRVLLLGEARLSQGMNAFSGSRLEYSAGERVVRAAKGTDSPGRVQVVIQPPKAAPPVRTPAEGRPAP